MGTIKNHKESSESFDSPDNPQEGVELSATARVEIASLLQNNIEQQKERWRAGWQKYQDFLESLTASEKQELIHTDSTRRPIPPRNLQAIFLGEKPSILDRYSDSFRTKISSAGLESTDIYIYDPVAVMNIVQRYPEEFRHLPTANAAVLMQALTESALDASWKERGLLLGFPFSAMRTFDRVQSGSITQDDIRAYGIHGYNWSDLQASTESQEQTERIMAAFRACGESPDAEDGN